MHIDGFNGAKNNDGIRQIAPLILNEHEDDFGGSLNADLVSTPTTPHDQFNNWDAVSNSLSPIQLSPIPRESSWENMDSIFLYSTTTCPATFTNGEDSPGSTGSEAVTANSWGGGVFNGSEYGEYSSDEIYDGVSRQRLPSVETAFSRSFGNASTNYSSYSRYRNCNQDYQESAGYGENLQLHLPLSLQTQSQDDINMNASLEIVDEFDLSLIRGTPTMLLNDISSVSSGYVEEITEPFVNVDNLNSSAVGHYVKNQHTGSALVNFKNNNLTSLVSCGDTGNQIVLPREETVDFSRVKRRKSSTCGSPVNGHDDSFGKFYLFFNYNY